jgi:hypothetical protein
MYTLTILRSGVTGKLFLCICTVEMGGLSVDVLNPRFWARGEELRSYPLVAASLGGFGYRRMVRRCRSTIMMVGTGATQRLPIVLSHLTGKSV